VLTPAPLHPELLDWLTSEFIASGYNTRHLHRLIVLSATYRQRSDMRSEESGKPATESAPQPGLYASFPRQRLTSERIRDSWLASAGTLNDTMYGPGVRPELPPNFGGAANWKVSDPADRTRRSVYIYAKRNLPYPLMAAFDFPDMHETCGCRTKTTIAPQALMMLNSNLILDAARRLAARAKSESDSADPQAPILQAWTIALGRQPTPRETKAAQDFITNQQQVIASSDSSRTGEDTGKVKDSDADEAFVDFCHALLNANEFLFVE
jgi:hypothetical protein